MTTTSTQRAGSTASQVAGAWVPEPGLRQDLRAIKIVWQRDLIRFTRDRSRMFVYLLNPLLNLFVLGTGLTTLTAAFAGFDFRTFMFPGVLAMTVMFTALFSAGSLVWDREFGFLREMLVAPVSRTSIVIGKCLGGTTVAGIQGVLMLAIAGLAGVPYHPTLIITLVAEMLLLAFTLTAFGTMMAIRMKSIQSFMTLMQMIMMPMLMLSGAMFPLSNLPTWLRVMTHINPMTYAVDPMRRAIFDHIAVSLSVRGRFGAGVAWWRWQVPAIVDVGLVAALGLIALGAAVKRFSKPE